MHGGDETDEAKQRFLALFHGALADGTFARLSLGGHIGADRTLKRLFIRPVRLRGELKLSFVFRHATRDITKNYSRAQGCQRVGELLGTDFRTAHLSTTAQTAQLECQAGRAARLKLGEPQQAGPVALEHDRAKPRVLDLSAAAWLHDLGVTTAEGKVARGMEPKFRQIHRFVELLQALFMEARLLPEAALAPGASTDRPAPPPAKETLRTLRVADMGCGKGYLTVATYAWLRQLGIDATVRGLDVRPELVQAGNELARRHRLPGLSFQVGNIASTPVEKLEVLIALHACDTATDDAIAKGIQAEAALIVVSPCCHREVRPQMHPPPALVPIFKHGILLERQAELLTDALRAALLEWAGYETRVFEFISTEHTSKNLLIAGAKRRIAGPRGELERRVRELAAFYGLKHQRLAEQLKLDLAPSMPCHE